MKIKERLIVHSSFHSLSRKKILNHILTFKQCIHVSFEKPRHAFDKASATASLQNCTQMHAHIHVCTLYNLKLGLSISFKCIRCNWNNSSNTYHPEEGSIGKICILVNS